jgi:GDP-4-dehydro-6-deoxy-D-mannose reductase
MWTINESRILITGISGFVGTHLASHLRSLPIKIFGVDCCDSSGSASGSVRGYELLIGDLLDQSFVHAALNDSRPTHIFHLAGVLGGAAGGSATQYTVNLLGTVTLLESIISLGLSPWIMVASSSAVYGKPKRTPTDESEDLRPLTTYAASKAAQEMAALQAQLSHGMRIVRTRTFNLIGAGQSRALLTSDLAYQVALGESTGSRCLRVGNLSPRRDYSDIRDVVRAYSLLCEKNISGDVFNVCSGKSHSVQECVDVLMKLSRVPLELKVESSRMRHEEIDEQVGNPQKLQEQTRWRPEISFEQSLSDLLDDCRRRVKSERA